MKTFSAADVTITHQKLSDGRGHLRLTHRPSGLSVDGDVTIEPVMRVAVGLMNQLRQKVLHCQGLRQSDEEVATAEDRA